MPLDEEVKAYLERSAASGVPARSEMSVAETREFYRRMVPLAGEAPELSRVEDRTIPGPAGEIPVRVYAGAEGSGLPVLAYFHGGRFFSGDLETHDPVCRSLAKLSGWLVLAVDYRLAPEHPFPAAVEDTCAAVGWLAGHGAEIGADPRRIAVGGDSAGGNLAAATALVCRDEDGPELIGQLLIYPMLDATCSLPSHETFASGYGPGSEDMQRGYREYLPADADPKDPHISPYWASDVSALPPAFVVTAEYDSLRDEGELYARALDEAGIPVVVARYEGAIHGFFQLDAVMEVGRRALRDTAAYMRALSA